MSQTDIIEYLKKHPDKWFTAKDLLYELEISKGALDKNLIRIRKSNEVLAKQEQFYGTRERYYYKIKKVQSA